MDDRSDEGRQHSIAIVGMAGRFPGAATIEDLWRNLQAGAESVEPVDAGDLRAAGLDPSLLEEDDYVGMSATLAHADCFDASFFGYLPRDAALIDPQQRVLLECAWAAMENAGYRPLSPDGLVGVYAGVARNTYLPHIQASRPDVLEAAGEYQTMIAGEKDFPATRVGYKLDLRGPCLNVQTACSTSGVAIHLACQSLLTGDCDIALAGGARVLVPLRTGYRFEDGGILSPDGHCRAFDASAEGTIRGSGAAFVVLKRYSDAVADGDTIRALIRGTAINNDGAAKVGFTAPSIQGQAAVVSDALSIAGVDPSSIGYVEAHGTGTRVGDPIEVAGLTKAFRRLTSGEGFCGIGSIKSNIGHLDAAAAVTGLIKATFCVEQGLIPPSLHFNEPNPQIDFDRSPFYVVDELRPWTSDGPRRAGVSSFGLGGTNAHIVIEQAPQRDPSPASEGHEILVLSGRRPEAIATMAAELASALESRDLSLADVAHTLQVGRARLPHRAAVVAGSRDGAIARLQGLGRLETAPREGAESASVVFLFPGGGAQHQGMGAGLYTRYPTYRRHLGEALEAARARSGIDLAPHLVPGSSGTSEGAAEELARPSVALPALFSVEVAVARLLMSWGLRPDAMIGHSLGEYAAAHLAGVLTLDDAVALVAKRGELFERAPDGAMLSVPLGEEEVRARFPDLSVGAINRPDLCVLSGRIEEIDAAEEVLEGEGLDYSRIHISVPAHSSALEPILSEFSDFVSTIPLAEPGIPYVSNVTGDWIDADDVTKPDYWVRHLRQTVRFDAGLGTILDSGGRALVEVGPGRTLSGLARQHAGRAGALSVTPSMRHPKEDKPDEAALLEAVGDLWTSGATVDWREVRSGAPVRRVPLPTYPFERTRCWIDPGAQAQSPADRVGYPNEPSVPPSSETTPPPMTNPTAPPRAPDEHRSARLLRRVQEIFGELSGLTPDEVQPDASFLELGFESLSLTQGSMAVNKEFSVDLSFRQLLEGLTTPARLTAYLDETLAPDVMSSPIPDRMESPGGTIETTRSVLEASPQPGTVPDGLAGLMAEQLRLMSEQLRMIAAGGLEPSTPPEGSPRPSPSRSSGEPTSSTTSEPKTSPKGPWRPIDKSAASGLDDRRQQHLAELTARLNAKTRESKRWTQRNRSHLSDPRTVAGFRRMWKELVYPVVVTRSQGSRLWDLDGNEYVDLAMGFGVNLLGHSPEFVTEAVKNRLDLGVEIGPQTPLAGEVAEMISRFTGHERVAFSNTGSEAVLAAIRMARTVTGRTKIVTFDGDYHGIFDEVLARPVGAGARLRSVPVAPGIPGHMVDSILALPYGEPSSLERIEELADDLALVLVEPVQSRHPDLQPVDFLRSLRSLTERLSIPLVFDEMITGFRCHPGGAQALFGVQADIATYGKVVGGGFPIGVVAGRAEFMDALDGGMWSFGDDSFPETGVTWFAGTFVRHPVALTASRAVLRHLESEGPALQETLNARTEVFVDELNAYFRDIGAPIWLERFSSFFLIKFMEDLEYSSIFYYHLRDHGVHITEGRSAFLSTAHSDHDLEILLEAFKASARTMQEGGFLSGSDVPKSRDVGTRQRLVPVTEAQEEIWLAATSGRGAECAFNLSNRLELRGPLDVRHLRDALGDLADRHEALRTTFTDDGRLMLIAEAGEIPVTEIDLTSSEDSEGALQELARRDVETPFDLVRGPLARATIIRLGVDHHVLFLTVHHVVCDGWSCGILLRDLGELYRARTEGHPAELAAPAQLSAYAHRQERYQGSAEALRVEEYWLDLFSDDIPRLDVPTDFRRPSQKTFSAAREEIELDPTLVDGLASVAAKHGCTSFTVFLAAFEAFLARLAQQSDFVVGVSAAGQMAAGTPDLVGHCVSLLPVRTRVDSTRPFTDHLRDTRTRILDAFDNQGFTFGTLLKRLSVPRDPGRLPVVDVVFNMDSTMSGLDYPGIDVESGSNPRAFENFELFVNVVTTGSGTRIECTYNTDLFTRETMRRRLAEFAVFLGAIVEAPGEAVALLPIVTEEERRTLLEDWNDTATTFESRTLTELFEEQVRRTPDAEALVIGRDRLSFAEVNEAANRLAHLLRSRGVGAGTLVAVCATRGRHLIPAILGILKAGAGYVPLDPEYPADRLRFMLEDSGAPLLVTETALQERMAPLGVDTVAVDADLEDQPIHDPEAQHRAGDVAYVIYTSGSTGTPKGVVIEHGNAAALLAWARTVFEPEDLHGVLFATSICFDLSVFEIFLPLTSDGRVILASNVLELPDLPHSADVSLVNTVPSAMAALVAGGRIPDGVRTVCLAGEPLSPDLVDRIYRETTAVRVFDLYGPSEDTTYSTWALREEGGVGTIGRPIANTRAYVLDQNRQLLPIGVPGELYLSGAGVARGYLHREDLTAERFLDDPFAGAGVGRMYRTGDMVCYMADGRLVFMGRRDNQVKLRGFRIELGEIEAVLRKHEDVETALAVVREGGDDAARLVAYVVGDGDPNPEDLMSYLASRLPAHMVPGSIVMLDDLPTLPNGKLDRSRLPDPEPGAGSASSKGRPETEAERLVADAWRSTLGVETVAVDDDFFALGGSSLQAVRVLNRLQEELGTSLSAAVIFEYPTVRALAAHLSREHPDAMPASAAISNEEREEVTL